MYALQSGNSNLRLIEQGNNTASSSSDSGATSTTPRASGAVTRTLDSKTRHVVRTLRNLRDDLKRLYPKELMPSTWMIKCLVVSCTTSPREHSHENWDSCVIGLMQRLRAKTENAFEIRNSFFELDGITPLFPNYELFGPQHANRFAKLAAQHLKMQLGKDDSKWSARAIR